MKSLSTPKFYITITTLLLLLLLGIFSSGFVTVGSIMTTPDGDGFITSESDEKIQVLDIELGRSTIPTDKSDGTDAEIIIANYNNETIHDVNLNPKITSNDIDITEDNYRIEPETEQISEIEPGEIKTYSFYIGAEYESQSELPSQMQLELQDETIEDTPTKNVTLVSDETSITQSRIIDRGSIDSYAYSPSAYKDELTGEVPRPASNINIPPVLYEDGTIEEYDIGSGRIQSFGSFSDDSTTGYIESQNGINVGLKYDDISEHRHYVIRADYNDEINSDIELQLVDYNGNEIDENSDYMLSPNTGHPIDYHLTSEEVQYIQQYNEAYLTINSDTSENIENINYIELKGVNQIIDLPTEDLKVHDISVDKSGNPPTYEINESVEIIAEIENTGNATYNGNIDILEHNHYGSSVDTTETTINPSETKEVSFNYSSDVIGSHVFQTRIDETESKEIVIGDVDEMEINPFINVESPQIQNQTYEYTVSGVYDDNISQIEQVNWYKNEAIIEQISDINNTGDLNTEHSIEDSGIHDIHIEIEYTKDGELKTGTDAQSIQVIDEPEPEINAQYNDISVGSRELFGDITGSTYSIQTLSSTDNGYISVNNSQRETLGDGMDIIIIDNNGPYEPTPTYYASFDYDNNEYIESEDGTPIHNVETENITDINSYIESKINEHNTNESEKTVIATGTGEMNDNPFTTFGANQYDIDENQPYMFTGILEQDSTTDVQPISEKYYPPENESEIFETIQITPVEYINTIPDQRPVYLTVDDQNNTGVYQETDLEWSNVQEYDHNYMYTNTGTSDKTITVEDEFNNEDTKTLDVTTDYEPTISLNANPSSLNENQTSTVNYVNQSIKPYDLINHSNIEFNVTEYTEDINYKYDNYNNLIITSGETSGYVQAEVQHNGVIKDNETITILSDLEAHIDAYNKSGQIRDERPVLSLYDNGNKTALEEIIEYGNGNIEFNNTTINMSSTDDESAYLTTDEFNLSTYDNLHVNYTINNISDNTNTDEIAYVSAHTGEITSDNTQYGEPGTIRGTDLTDITKTSNTYINDEQTQQKQLTLDLSDENDNTNIVIHTRANENQNIDIDINEIWLEEQDVQLGDNIRNIKPDKNENQFRLTQNGFNIINESEITSRNIGNIEEFNVLSEPTVSTDVNTNATINAENNTDFSEIDILSTPIDDEYTDTVKLDATESSALEDDNFTWSIDRPTDASIKNPTQPQTVVEFNDTGIFEVTLTIESEFGKDTTTHQINVKETPDISVNTTDHAYDGQEIETQIIDHNNTNIEEIIVFFGNEEYTVIEEPQTITYENYQNLGKQEIIAFAKTETGEISIDSDITKIDQHDIDTSTDEIELDIGLPNNAIIDTQGTQSTIPDNYEPGEIFDISGAFENPELLDYTWYKNEEIISNEEVLKYETGSETGITEIQLEAEDQTGDTDEITILLEKHQPEELDITSLSMTETITPDGTGSTEPFDIETTIEQPIDTNITYTVEIGNETKYKIHETETFGSGSHTIDDITFELDPEQIQADSEQDITITAEDNYGNKDTTKQNVYIEDILSFDLIHHSEQPYEVQGDDITFEVDGQESYGEPLEYTWEFVQDDDIYEDQSQVTHNFETPDPDYVLNITAEDTTGTQIQQIYELVVQSGLTADLNIGYDPTEQKHTLDASNSVTTGENNEITTYLYAFDTLSTDEHKQTGEDVVHKNYEEINDDDKEFEFYMAELEIQDEAGFDDDDSKIFSDNINLENQILTVDEINEYDGLTIQSDTVTEDDIEEITWEIEGDFEDEFTSNEPNFIYQFDETGNVELTATIEWTNQEYVSISGAELIISERPLSDPNPEAPESCSDIASEAGWTDMSEPYPITNDHELQCMSWDTSADYEIQNNISLEYTEDWNDGNGFNPVDLEGTLDGKEHYIEGLHIDRSSDTYVGLIGYGESNSVVKNLRIENASVTGNDEVGVLAGRIRGEVQNSSVQEFEVNASYRSAGLVGRPVSADLSNQLVVKSGNVETSGSDTGGLAGRTSGSTKISDAYVSDVSVEGDITGGIMGGSSNVDSEFSNMYAAVDDTDGAIVGDIQSSGDVFNDSIYWDETRTSDPYGTGSTSATRNWIPKVTDEMTGSEALDSGNMENLDESIFTAVDDEDEYPVFDWEIQSEEIEPIADFEYEETDSESTYELDASESTAYGDSNDIEEYRFDINNDGNFDYIKDEPVVIEVEENLGDEITLEVVDSMGQTDSVTKSFKTGFEETLTFDNCGSVGRYGPSSCDYGSEFEEAEIEPTVEDGYQYFEVPETGVYNIKSKGAAGGGGDGAVIQGEVQLEQGEQIIIAVGQEGGTYAGGGGTFVAKGSDYDDNPEPLIVAGGGGGDGNSGSTKNGNTGTCGTEDGGGSVSPACDGEGGNVYSVGNSREGGGGGGFLENGDVTGHSDLYMEAEAFVNGAEGNTGGRSVGPGSFGGGSHGNGGGWGEAGGGGGGYSGGAGGERDNPNYTGGGGGSFITSDSINASTSDGTFETTGTEPHEPYEGSVDNLGEWNTGHGEVQIEYVE